MNRLTYTVEQDPFGWTWKLCHPDDDSVLVLVAMVPEQTKAKATAAAKLAVELARFTAVNAEEIESPDAAGDEEGWYVEERDADGELVERTGPHEDAEAAGEWINATAKERV